MFKKSFRLIQVREELLFRLKFCGMHAAAAATQFDGMLQVQHFVINDVFHRVAGNSRVIEDAADDDRVMSGIVVAEPVASMVAAPSHPRSSQQAIEESLVQIFENIFQIVDSSLGTIDPLAAAHWRTKWAFW